MDKELHIAGHRVLLSYKRVKNINMRLQSGPDGPWVAMSAPRRVPMREIVAFVVSKSDWITQNMAKLAARQKPQMCFDAGTLHYFWGDSYPLHIIPATRRQKAYFDGAVWRLQVRADASDTKKAALMEAAYKQALLQEAQPLMAAWAGQMGVRPQELKTQKMRSRWGSCHVSRGIIKLNSELARKPRDLLEYVLVHELVHLFERGHNARFYALMDKFLPDWRARKQMLNAF